MEGEEAEEAHTDCLLDSGLCSVKHKKIVCYYVYIVVTVFL